MRVLPVVLTIAVATLAAVAWGVLSRDGRDGRDAADELAQARARNPTPPPDETSPPAKRLDPTVTTEVDRDAADRSAGAATRDRDPPTAPEDQTTILVRRADDKEPVAGAQVTWTTVSAFWAEYQRRGGADENELVLELGKSDTTDHHGLLVLPRSNESLLICARLGSLWAIQNPGARAATVTIDLALEDSIQVQVVESRGAPQPGVVALFGRRSDIAVSPLRRATTEGPAALATIRGVSAFARLFGGDRDAEWGVSVLLPLREPLFVPVDLHALSTAPNPEPFVIKLPPAGRVALTLVGRDGQPFLRRAQVRWSAFERADAEGHPGRRIGALEPRMETSTGALELPNVDVGLSVKTIVEVDHLRVATEQFDGPDRVGESVSRTLQIEFGPVAFTGTLVEGEDLPVMRESVTLRVLAARGENVRPFETPCIGEGTTDDQGAFSIEVPVAGVEPRSFDVELVVHDAYGNDSMLRGVAVVGEKGGSARLGQLRLP